MLDFREEDAALAHIEEQVRARLAKRGVVDGALVQSGGKVYRVSDIAINLGDHVRVTVGGRCVHRGVRRHVPLFGLTVLREGDHV